MDLPQAGVAVDAKGFPAVDPFTLRAKDSCIFLAGDAAADRPLMHEAADVGLIATHGEHLSHLLAWAIQRRQTIDRLLAMSYYHASIKEMVQSALKDAARGRHGPLVITGRPHARKNTDKGETHDTPR